MFQTSFNDNLHQLFHKLLTYFFVFPSNIYSSNITPFSWFFSFHFPIFFKLNLSKTLTKFFSISSCDNNYNLEVIFLEKTVYLFLFNRSNSNLILWNTHCIYYSLSPNFPFSYSKYFFNIKIEFLKVFNWFSRK